MNKKPAKKPVKKANRKQIVALVIVIIVLVAAGFVFAAPLLFTDNIDTTPSGDTAPVPITGCSGGALCKPIIYLYPTQESEVSVTVGKPENLSHTYPKYKSDGWYVLARPNGDLVDLKLLLRS